MDLTNIEGLDAETRDGASASPAAASPITQAQFEQFLNAMRNERGSNRAKASKSGGRDVGKRFNLTPEQVREHFDKRQCFCCGSTEHTSRRCPRAPKN